MLPSNLGRQVSSLRPSGGELSVALFAIAATAAGRLVGAADDGQLLARRCAKQERRG
jgi:hypothetical protein